MRLFPGTRGAPRQEDLLALGDSITGNGVRELAYPATFGTWPMFIGGYAHAGLVINTVGSVKEAVNGGYRAEGHSGYTTTQLLAALPAWLTSYPRVPSVCVLLAGFNDMSIPNGPIPNETTIDNHLEIDTLLRAAGCKRVVHCTLTGTAGGYAARNAGIVVLNALLRPEFEDVLDLNDGFDATTMTYDTVNDGLHHNRAVGAPYVAGRVAAHLGW